MATANLPELIWDSLVEATFGDVGLLLLVLFIVYIVVMAKFRVPIVPSAVIGIVLLVVLGSLFSPVFSPLLAVLIMLGGVALGYTLLKLGGFK